MMEQIKKNKIIKIATIILLFLSINLNAQSVDWELINELVDNIKQGDLESRKKLEAHLFGILYGIGGSVYDYMREDIFLETIEYVNKKINFNFNATDRYYGETFLMIASRKGSLKIVKSLIGYGADVNAKNKYGSTALMLTSSLEVAKLLIDNGADINAKDNDGDTALTRHENLKIIKLLVENGADIDARDISMFGTLLIRIIDNIYHHTSDYEYSEVLENIKFLIDNGADVNIKDKEGNTVLHKTIYILGTLDRIYTQEQDFKLVLEITKLLVDNGADINAKDEYGNTALTYAKRKGSDGEEIVKFLISRGAK